jgi:hypothetical protein
LATEDTSLHSSTISNGFVWVNATIWFFAIEKVFNQRLDLWNTSGATNEHDFVDFTLLHACIIEHGLDWSNCLLEKVSAKFFKTSTSQGLIKVNSVDKAFNGDFNLNNAGKISLGLFNFTLKFLKGSAVTLDIDAIFLLEEFDEVVSNALIEIFTSQMGVT